MNVSIQYYKELEQSSSNEYESSIKVKVEISKLRSESSIKAFPVFFVAKESDREESYLVIKQDENGNCF